MRKERPSFEKFREYFFAVLEKEIPGHEIAGNTNWEELVNEEARKKILHSLKAALEGEYNVELVITPDLYNANCSLEGLVSRLHHVFSTVYLMERINDKIRARQH
ncbi:MAG: hypothetical protein VR69_13140 [Peptococcaceae bacterium BRH_c4b]|nr:MAG: hypothetical protein VR69_13140 [Peptococcaceae bacterium BRH_c4b]